MPPVAAPLVAAEPDAVPPGLVAPGELVPGMVMPGMDEPGAVAPGVLVPGMVEPAPDMVPVPVVVPVPDMVPDPAVPVVLLDEPPRERPERPLVVPVVPVVPVVEVVALVPGDVVEDAPVVACAKAASAANIDKAPKMMAVVRMVTLLEVRGKQRAKSEKETHVVAEKRSARPPNVARLI